MKQWEDFSINNEDDIYFDSSGDIAANYIDVDIAERKEQLTKDIYHSIKVHEKMISSFSSDEERKSYIKSLFLDDTRIKSFDVNIDGNDITISNVEMK